jgi:hypothetical protein
MSTEAAQRINDSMPKAGITDHAGAARILEAQMVLDGHPPTASAKP